MAGICGHKQSLIFKEKAHLKVYLQSHLSVCPKQIYVPFTQHLFLLSVWAIFYNSLPMCTCTRWTSLVVASRLAVYLASRIMNSVFVNAMSS